MSTDGDVTGNHGDFDYWILKLDSAGNLVWQKSLGGSEADEAYSIQQTIEGGFIVAGATSSNNGDVSGFQSLRDYWIVKLETSGTIAWQKCLGGFDYDRAYSVQQTTDTGYIVAGYSNSIDGDVSGNHGYADYWIVKLDTEGNIIWQKSFGGTEGDVAYSIQQTTDGGFIVAGYSLSADGNVTGNQGFIDYWIIKLNGAGNIVWKKSLGGTEYDFAYSVQQTFDGGFIVAGFSNSNSGDISGNHGLGDYWILKLNSFGNLEWQKCLGGSNNEEAHSIQQTADGGFIIAGASESNNGDVSGNHNYPYGYNSIDYWIVKLDMDGNMVWQKSLGGSFDDHAQSIQQTSDGSFIIAGSTYSNDGDVSANHLDSLGYNSYDYWIVKLRVDSVTGIAPLSNNFISFYPNPVQTQLFINFAIPANDIVGGNVRVFDLQGRIIDLPKSLNNTQLQLNTTSLPNGFYTLQIINNKTGESEMGKFVKQE